VIRVLVAEDQEPIRALLRASLAALDDVELVGEARDGEEALVAVEELRPDVVLMDLAMPRIDGQEATRRIVDRHPRVRVVVLSAFGDRASVLRALEAGAAGYLLKDDSPEEVARGIRSAMRGEAPLSTRASSVLVDDWRSTRQTVDFTERELDVLLALADGLPNKLIARRLDISEKTVKSHLTRIFKAIGVSDREEAVHWLDRTGVGARERVRRERARAIEGAA
jgi:DNA-binding NarL/FixJ family response regulator